MSMDAFTPGLKAERWAAKRALKYGKSLGSIKDSPQCGEQSISNKIVPTSKLYRYPSSCLLTSVDSSRAFHHMDHLLALLDQFPRTNPPEDVDVAKMFRQIRSRYKALCASLGVRPSLRAANDGQPSSPSRSDRQLWKLESDTKRLAEEDQGLNF
jgi:hypothetical protein